MGDGLIFAATCHSARGRTSTTLAVGPLPAGRCGRGRLAVRPGYESEPCASLVPRAVEGVKVRSLALVGLLFAACGAPPQPTELRANGSTDTESAERERCKAVCSKLTGEARSKEADCVWLDCPGTTRSEALIASRGGLERGMSACVVEASLGPTLKPKKNIRSNGATTTEQWVLPGPSYIYFENGRVVSWSYSE